MGWAKFVAAWAKKHNMSLKKAMSDPKCKSEYHSQK